MLNKICYDTENFMHTFSSLREYRDSDKCVIIFSDYQLLVVLRCVIVSNDVC